ncbi:phage portal protein [Arthrobacter sp. OY3WO11]|uniref:phage portal protein n=1 Tax=Arthrobacter sp. OY3WO11 TaxID=1835723 RepID=UPI0009ED2D02|nr:phage portal protein [Arthrobacter sp. OY3WO11]
MGLKELTSNLIDSTLGQLGKKKSATMTLDELWTSGSALFNRGGTKLTNTRAYMQQYLDWVYAAASTIAKDTSQIDYRAYANRGTTKTGKMAGRMLKHQGSYKAFLRSQPTLEELDNHILLDLLDHPNVVMDGQRFQELTDLHMVLAGEAFWGILRNGLGKAEQLWPMMPHLMKHVVGDDGAITGWVYRVNGKDIPWDAADIVHFPLTDPNNIYRGMSVVRAAARAIETDAHAADWNRNFFFNSARPDLALETDQTLTPQVFERMKEQWNDEYQGTANAHKVAILEAGLKLNKLTMTQKEMDFLESRKYNRDQILAMFGVSRVMLGLIEGDGRSNMEAAEYNHAKRVVRPLMARKASVINHRLAPEYDSKLIIGFTDPVPEDKEFLLKERTSSVNLYKTVNEVRAELGDEGINGGDTLFVPNSLRPIEQALLPPEPEPTELPADDTEGKKSLGKQWLEASTKTKTNAS